MGTREGSGALQPGAGSGLGCQRDEVGTPYFYLLIHSGGRDWETSSESVDGNTYETFPELERQALLKRRKGHLQA